MSNKIQATPMKSTNDVANTNFSGLSRNRSVMCCRCRQMSVADPSGLLDRARPGRHDCRPGPNSYDHNTFMIIVVFFFF